MKIAAHLKTQSDSPDLESNFPQKILRTNYVLVKRLIRSTISCINSFSDFLICRFSFSILIKNKTSLGKMCYTKKKKKKLGKARGKHLSTFFIN